MKQRQKKPIDYWQPQPKQRLLLEIAGLADALEGGPVHPALTNYIGYGGAAGGGKTEGMLGLSMVALTKIPGVRIGFFRRKFTELEGSDGPIERTMYLFPQIGGKYNKSSHVWRFGEGGVDFNEGTAPAFRFCHCQYENTVHDYQSSAFDILLFDETTHFTWNQVRYLLTRNRVSRHSKIPRPFSVMATNPGNVGHMWYKQVYDIKSHADEKRGLVKHKRSKTNAI